jgi:hypothetical protein
MNIVSELKNLNPANRTGGAERKRIPMSVPVQKLSVPDIPGYHLHWFMGTPERLGRAMEGGYEFVDDVEAAVNDTSLGGTSTRTGNTDMGSRVSVVAGSEVGRDGQPVRLVLMKIKQEWYEEDQKLVEQRNDSVVNSLLGGQQAAGGNDASNRYVDQNRTKIPDFFKRKVAIRG